MKNNIIIGCHESNAYWYWEIYGYRPDHTTLTWSKNESTSGKAENKMLCYIQSVDCISNTSVTQYQCFCLN